MKTKRSRLAPMEAASLLGLVLKNETQQDIAYSGTTRVVRKKLAAPKK